MTITNKLNLPKAFVLACQREQHNKPGSYSATTLIKGVKHTILESRHWGELVEDAADQVWSIFGTAVHAILEREAEGEMIEISLETQINGKRITGRLDNYDKKNDIITDYKTACVWKVQFNDFEDWKTQGLIYAWLLRVNGYRPSRCRFVALLKDHSKSKARHDLQYPQSPVFVYEFDVTTDLLEWAGEFVDKRVKELESANVLSDDDIPPCTKKERWEKGESWAVMRPGRKSAVRVFDHPEAADKMTNDLRGGHYTQHRPGECKKCLDYCNVKNFCNFYRDSVAKKDNL